MIRSLLSHLTYLVVGLLAIAAGLWLTASLVQPVFSANDLQDEAQSELDLPPADKISGPVENEGEDRQSSKDNEGEESNEDQIITAGPSQGLSQDSGETAVETEPQRSAGLSRGPNPELRRILGASDLEAFLQQFNYSAEGRRDPFQPYEEMRITIGGEVLGPLLPLQRFDLDQLKLVGIIWDVSDPKAMFLDPGANVHLVGKDDRIGRNNGYIAVIREGEVVIIETTEAQNELMYSSRVIRLNR